MLTEALGTSYVEAALETYANYCKEIMSLTILPRAQVRIEAFDSKSEPSLQPLTIIHSVDLICHLWQQYVNTALLPLASSSVTIRREMVVFNTQTITRLENGANNLLQRFTDSKFPHSLSCNRFSQSCSFSDCCLVVKPIDQTKEERL